MTRALALLLTLTACADRSGVAGCFEPMPDGRAVYRAGWAPQSSGMCPTPAEAVAAQAVAPDECGTACRLHAAAEAMR